MHEITVTDGVEEAMFALTPAWHGLGKVLDYVPTSEQALAESGIDWNVVQTPAGEPDGERWDNKYGVVVPNYRPSTQYVMNIREDTRKVLGIVGKNYKVLQNREAFTFLDELFQDDVLRYESAFSLRDGKVVILLARVPQRFTILPGDDIAPYLAFAMHHDGSGAIKSGLTFTRIVCANTYRMAERDLVNIRHSTGDLNESLLAAKENVQKALEVATEYAEMCKVLSLIPVAWEEYLDEVCPMPIPTDKGYTKLRVQRISDTRDQLTDLFENDPTCNIPGMEGSLWAAWNSVTHHVDHMPRRGGEPRRKLEARYNVTQYGTGHNIKALALDVAKEMAGV